MAPGPPAPLPLPLLLLPFFLPLNAADTTAIHNTTSGPVQGSRIKRAQLEDLPQLVDSFTGIPYAAPPVGNNRFRAPQPGPSWSNVRKATRPGPICPQFRVTGKLLLGKEDCLYLNVWVPSSAAKKAADGEDETSLPVFFWIYGGGYVIGDGEEFGLYNGARLAATHNMMVVTINYRLGGLGFFALDELRDEDPDSSTGNYALQDQRAALKWVHENARAFGGDPSRITIAGESAGGFSVVWHLVSPLSRPLFSAAIIESGTNSVTWFFQPYDQATSYYEDRAAILGCPKSRFENSGDRLACLRKIPYEELVISFEQWGEDMVGRDTPLMPIPKDVPQHGSSLFPVMPYGPVIDKSQAGLMDTPIALVSNGNASKVPIIIGANKNGGNLLLESLTPFVVPGGKFSANNKSLTRSIHWLVNGDDARRALNLYTEKEYQQAWNPDEQIIADLLRDCVFQCSDRRMARAWTLRGLPTFLYTFSFDLGPLDRLFHGGDFHASELPFVFKTYLSELSLVGVPHPKRTSNIISCLWARFVHCHDPNLEQCKTETSLVPGCESSDLPSHWPRFDDDAYPNGAYLSMKISGEGVQAHPLRANNTYPDNEFPSGTKCDFWDSVNLSWHSPRQKPEK